MKSFKDNVSDIIVTGLAWLFVGGIGIVAVLCILGLILWEFGIIPLILAYFISVSSIETTVKIFLMFFVGIVWLKS